MINKGKKGFYFTLDALFALLLLISVIILIPYTGIKTTEQQYQTSYLQEDALNILSTVRTNEINNVHINNILSNQTYNESFDNTDTLIDTISKLWATNYSDDAKNVTGEFFEQVIQNSDNFGIFFRNSSNMLEPIFMKNSTGFESSTDVVGAKYYVSGVQQGVSVKGYTARAFIQKKEKTKIVYFGGYIGDGDISAVVELTNITAISNISLELAPNILSKFYINDHFIQNIPYSSDELVPITVYLSNNSFGNLTNGTNIFKFENVSSQTNPIRLSISGGYIKIVYKTNTPEYAEIKRQYLPGIDGVINEYDSIYSPNTMNYMKAHLHYDINLSEAEQANATIFLEIANVTVYENVTKEDVTNFTKDLENDDLLSIFKNYNALSNQTIPIRVGFKEIAASNQGNGNADVVLITDVSGSMGDVNINCSMSWNISTVRKMNGGTYSAGSVPSTNTYYILRDNGKVCMSRAFNFVDSNTNITFWWKVSSRTGDNLSFYINNVSRVNITGNYPNGNTWEQKNFTLGAGQYEIKWCYKKDGSQTQNDDRGYVDNITIRNSSRQIFSDDFETGNLDGWYLSTDFGQCQKLMIAKDVDKVFVETVLNASGNQVGLTSYTSDPPIRNWTQLTSDYSSLIGQINTYTDTQNTCISCGIKNATEIVNRAAPGRFKGMLIMTDGKANTLINGTFLGTGYTSLSGYEATNWSCYARNATNNITVFSVGFGSSADVDIAQVKRMACWNCTACPDSRIADPPANSTCWVQDVPLPNGTLAKCLETRWAQSENYEELRQIYEQFGEWFLGFSYQEQRVNITGNFSSKLYPDSYIEYDYEPVSFGDGSGIPRILLDIGGKGEETLKKYGNVLTFESKNFINSITDFNFSDGILIDAIATSYSGPKWTKYVSVDNSSGSGFVTVFNLSNFGSNYALLGDPFRVNIPIRYVASNLTNTVKLKIANSSIASGESNASDYDKIIYTLLILSNYSYSNVTSEAEGCSWTVQLYDNSEENIPVPSNYTLENRCYFNSTNGPTCIDANTTSIIEKDAIAQATYMVFVNYLDKHEKDCKLDIKISDYYVNALLLPSVPFLHYTTAEVLTWR